MEELKNLWLDAIEDEQVRNSDTCDPKIGAQDIEGLGLNRIQVSLIMEPEWVP